MVSILLSYIVKTSIEILSAINMIAKTIRTLYMVNYLSKEYVNACNFRAKTFIAFLMSFDFVCQGCYFQMTQVIFSM